ncbi:MAG: alpha/beta fold hydrolase [Phycisphaerales bacterium]|nr:alpha/beta fold hydrolase [Phycisphaerales bacterium]
MTLAGTLTTPAGDGLFPAVLLITGSGPQNRDEEVFGHKPFWVIADYLTRQGIAVLRVDDRGVGGSTRRGAPLTATSFDFAEDVEAGISFLRTQREIDPASIGLIGHSEGGMIAPIVAARDPRVAFIILLAGPGVPCEQLLLRQDELMLRASGASEEEIAQSRVGQKAIFEIVLNEELKPENANNQIREIIEAMPELNQDTDASFQRDNREKLIGKISSPWFKTFLRYDPQPTLSQVTCPVLAINGELDLQVSCEENLEGIATALNQGGNSDTTIQSFPQLNHPLQHCKTGQISEYAQIDETISEEVLVLVAAWITERFIEK